MSGQLIFDLTFVSFGVTLHACEFLIVFLTDFQLHLQSERSCLDLWHDQSYITCFVRKLFVSCGKAFWQNMMLKALICADHSWIWYFWSWKFALICTHKASQCLLVYAEPSFDFHIPNVPYMIPVVGYSKLKSLDIFFFWLNRNHDIKHVKLGILPICRHKSTCESNHVFRKHLAI
jgi:hypothetical protein